MIADPYRVLGIREDATDQKLKKAYRDLSKKYHPDANPDDPKAAEEKFKEIQEAYRQITEARERGTSAYGREPQPSYSTGSSSGQQYSYKEYSSASSAFEDFFTQWRQAQEAAQQQSQSGYYGGSAQYDEVIRNAVNYINAYRYQEAVQVLNSLPGVERDAQWFYVSAIANQGVGNNITAMQFAKRAVDMEPGNYMYAQLLQRLQGGGVRYQSRGAEYSPATVNPGWCLSMCALNLFCNCFGGGIFC